MNRLPLQAALLLSAAVAFGGGPLRGQQPPPADAPHTAAVPVEHTASAPVEHESFLENPFHLGTLLQDTNADGIPDAVCGHIIVSSNPSAAENTAAANLAARVGYETSALTLPIVVQGSPKPVAGCTGPAQNIWIGAASLPPEAAASIKPIAATLGLGEGAVVAVNGGIAIVAPDPVGLLTAGDALGSR